MLRKCYNCKRLLPIEEFHRDSRNNLGHNYQCKDCCINTGRDYRQKHRKDISARNRQYRTTIKELGIAAYGGRCSCCGESDPYFLTIEHIGGRDKTIKRMTGAHEWQRLYSLGFPQGAITILCYNCNCCKGALGFCAHERTFK